MKLILGLALMGAVGFGGVITNPSTAVVFLSDSNTGSGTLSAGLNSLTDGTLTFSGTACFDGYCPGQGTPGAGPNYTVNDPLTLRATGITIECNSPSGCPGGTNIFFDFSMDFVTPPAGSIESVTFNLDGSAPADFQLGIDGGFSTCGSPCGSALSLATIPSETVTADGSGNLIQTLSLGSLTFTGTELKGSINLTLGALANLAEVQLPDSASVSFTATSSTAPEPATIGMIVAGFAGLALLARKRRA